jgi:hypothetical protein
MHEHTQYTQEEQPAKDSTAKQAVGQFKNRIAIFGNMLKRSHYHHPPHAPPLAPSVAPASTTSTNNDNNNAGSSSSNIVWNHGSAEGVVTERERKAGSSMDEKVGRDECV